MLSSVKMETHDLPEWNTFYSEASEVKKNKKQKQKKKTGFLMKQHLKHKFILI